MLEVIFVATLKESEQSIKTHGFECVCSLPYQVWRNASKLLVVSGIGLVNSSLAFAWAVENFKFDKALNIGAAGSTGLIKCTKSDSFEKAELISSPLGNLVYGNFYEVSKVCCIEPYNDDSFILSNYGLSLVTSSRPVCTAPQRERAAQMGALVDMEGYAFASAAKLFSKQLRMIKLVSDFSPECDISANIGALGARFAELEQVWR